MQEYNKSRPTKPERSTCIVVGLHTRQFPIGFLLSMPQDSASVLPSLKVLAVDDNRTNLHILSVFLKKLGHRVILAENGAEALQRFAEDRPDLILLDIMMPILDGFEVARRVKAHTSETWVPIIFLSALDRDENLVEGLEAGGDDYLTKPINFVVLEAKMRSMQRSLMLQQRSVESLKRLQTISDNVLEAIITISPDAGIVNSNAAAEKIFGSPVATLIGQDFCLLLSEPHRSRYRDYLTHSRSSASSPILGQEQEVEAMRHDGTLFPAELAISEVRLNDAPLFICVLRDVTERKRTERKLRENAEQLQAYYDATQAEQNLAMTLMQKQLHRRGLQDPRLRYTVIPAENFSGDIVGAMQTPEGRFYALLADATGHGLAAAISVLPILNVFYGMAAFNHSVGKIIQELNDQLHESVPVDRFVAITLVCLDEKAGTGEIWVGGTPQALLVNRQGHPVRNFHSTRLPLGILPSEALDTPPDQFTWDDGSQLLLFSDGLLDAENPGGQRFELPTLMSVLAGTYPKLRFDAILGALGHHLNGQGASDDISIMLIDCP